jgi:uncharacterized repeat protein (TIGR02543 family)
VRRALLWLALSCLFLAGCDDMDLRNTLSAMVANVIGDSTYFVTYDANGGIGNVPTDSTSYHQGAACTVLGNSGDLVEPGYTFAGWNTKADGIGTSYASGAIYTMGAADVTLYAVWIPDNLTFVSSGTSITITGFITTPTGSLSIPGGVTGIGNGAFSGCTGLTGVTIPGSVATIGDAAFQNCSALAGITIPPGVTNIGNSTFWGCHNLTSVTIPSSVTSIEDDAFYQCWALSGVSIPSGVVTIGAGAFYNCTLTNITIPSSVTSIGQGAFGLCYSLSSVTVLPTTPPTLPSGSQAFDNCSSSLQIHVPSGQLDIYKAATGWSDYASKIVSP